MPLIDLRPQAARRTPEELLKHLQTFSLDLKFSAGIWYFSPPFSRFHAKYQPDLSIEQRLDIAATLADDGLSALEAHYPNEINEDNLDLWRSFSRDIGIRLLTVIPLLFWDQQFEWGSLSSPIKSARQAAIERTRKALRLNRELNTDFAVLWPGIDGYENPFGQDFVSMRERFVDGLAEAMDAVPGVRIAFEPKPYEPRGRILFGTTPEGLLLAQMVEARLKNEENRKVLSGQHALVCMNPEIGHVLMGFEDLAYAFSWPLSEARLAHSHWNSQPLGNYDQDLNVGVVSPEQLEALLYTLKMHAYTGYFGIDINPERMPVETALRISMDAVRAANDRINSLDHESILFSHGNPDKSRGWLEAYLVRARPRIRNGLPPSDPSRPDDRLAPSRLSRALHFMSDYFLGIDIGTTSTKALLIDIEGRVKAEASSDYRFLTPQPGWAEQDAREWWSATLTVIRSVLNQSGISAAQVRCIGLTGQMHGLVLLDQAGEPLRPCIMWNDQRTAAQSEEIHRRIGRDRIIPIIGKPALPNFTAPKLLWVRQHEPHLWSRAGTILLPKDYVRFRLSDARFCDVADGSGTALLDVNARNWSEELITVLDIPRAWLPELRESTDTCTHISPEAARLTGLLAGTPIITGAGDQAAEAVGVGAIADSATSIAIGTSGVVFVSFDSCRIDTSGALHTYCHASPGRWHMMGVMLSAGGSLRWYRDVLATLERDIATQRGVDAYDFLAQQAATVPPGCEGLLFLPYLSGERRPHADPHARGVLFGLSLRHTRAHVTRAIFEGITFGLLDSLQLVRRMGITVSSVRVSGGGSRSPFWRQLLADAFNADVVTVNASHGAAYGAALLAAVGIGAFPSVDEACHRTIRETSRTRPGPAAAIYSQFFERYQALYQSLQPQFAAMGTVAGAMLSAQP